MKRKIFLFSVLLFWDQAFFASTITSVVCGNWNNPSTWNLSRVPLSTDTIVVNTFVSFDTDFTSSSPAILHVTGCGALCGLHNYTGCFLFEGVVFMNEITATYGHSLVVSSLNIQQMVTIINNGTSCDVNNGGSVCVGCSSACQNCNTSNKTDSLACQNGISDYAANKVIRFYPNPAVNSLNTIGITGKTKIIVLDMFGKRVSELETDTDTIINIAQLAQGIYSIISESVKGKTYSKLLVGQN